jgi:hypothetical protein
MSKEKEARHEERRFPCGDPSFLKEMRDMMKKGDVDCAQIMSRMMARCCGGEVEPTAPTDSPENEKQDK